jgi:O-antigen/teichoic acid export membrane protein
MRPIVKEFFDPAVHGSWFYASLLMIALFSRFMMPVLNSVLIAFSAPSIPAIASGIKLALDLVLIFAFRGGEPLVLLVALVVSWCLYVQALFVLAKRQLELPGRPDWLVLVITLCFLGGLFVPFSTYGFALCWLATGAYLAVSARKLLEGVK